MKFYSSTFVALFHGSWEGLDVYNSYLLQIWALEDHLDVFLLYTEGLFCICEGTKTWGHGREQAILSGQFLGYLLL